VVLKEDNLVHIILMRSTAEGNAQIKWIENKVDFFICSTIV
jgi:hypothetical protein